MNPAEYREAQDIKVRQLALMQAHAVLFRQLVRDAAAPDGDVFDPLPVTHLVDLAKLYGVTAPWVAEFEALKDLWSALHAFRETEHHEPPSEEHRETEKLLARKMGHRWMGEHFKDRHYDCVDVDRGLVNFRRYVCASAIRVLKVLLMGQGIEHGSGGRAHWSRLEA